MANGSFLKKVNWQPPAEVDADTLKALGAIEKRSQTEGFGYVVKKGGERQYYQIIKTTERSEDEKAAQGLPEYIKPFNP